MSDQKQKKSKEAKKNEAASESYSESLTSLPTEQQSFHTARDVLSSSDESQFEEPRSSYALATAEDRSEYIDDDEENSELDKTRFRSSLSIHNMQTAQNSTTSHISIKQSSIENLDPKAERKPLSESNIKLTPEPVGEPRKSVHIINDESRKSLNQDLPEKIQSRPSTLKEDSIKKLSRRSLNSPSFPTNLDEGHAFVYMVLPPDGGYGWVIVFVSFIIQVIMDGIVFSIGIILPFMAEDFNVDMTQAILISALQISFYYLSGPITSAVINKFGFRIVAMIGSFGGSLCLLIASFSPNLEVMLVFYSVLGGPCLAMTWVASQLIIGYYFEKYRSIANGLSCSGSGAGLIIFVQLNNYFVPQIGWRNNARFQAGLVMVCLFLSLAYAEVAPSKIGIIREQDPTYDISEDDVFEEHEVTTYNYTEPESVEPEDRAVEYLTLEKIPTKDLIAYQHRDSNRLNECCKRCFCASRRRSAEEEEEAGLKATKRFVIKKDLIERQDLYYTGPAQYSDHDRSAKREIIDGQDVELIDVDRPVHAINYSMSMFSARRTEPETALSTGMRCWECIKPSRWIPDHIKKSFRILFKFSLFRIMEFQVLFVSAFLFGLAFNIPFLFSKARLDLPAELLSFIPIFIGVTNFSFRIICGFIAFKFKKYVIYMCGSTIVLGGLACFVSAFYGSDNFWFQIAYASIFGVAPAFFSTLRAIIYVQYLGLENLTNAFGLVSMGMGTAIFLGTMIGGFLNEITGSYTASFAFAGLSIVFSGILKLILPYLSHRRQKTRKVKFQV